MIFLACVETRGPQSCRDRAVICSRNVAVQKLQDARLLLRTDADRRRRKIDDAPKKSLVSGCRIGARQRIRALSERRVDRFQSSLEKCFSATGSTSPSSARMCFQWND